MKRKSLDEHLFGAGPKRILALDGGGIRGLLTVQMLKRIESMVRERSGNDKMVLGDYFDLIGGTSTGAVIASCLALGWDVARIEVIYRELGNSIFESEFFRRGLLRPKFSSEPIKMALEREFSTIRMGDKNLLTGLAVIAKRFDTNSTWVIHNNPKGRYFNQRPDSQSIPNKDYLLRSVVRASTAAPTYFEPERIRIADDLEGGFVDGGVSPHNNPALQLLMLATLKGHALNWETGENNLLLVSLGTGSRELDLGADEVMDMKAVALGVRGLASLMGDASALNEQILQWLSTSPTARQIDREVGDLTQDTPGGKSLLTYLRYDVDFADDWVAELLSEEHLDSIHEMDKPENMDSLAKLGQEAARRISDNHFPKHFDVS